MDKQKMMEIAKSNPFAQYIGMELTEVKEGYAAGKIRMEKHHTNIYNGMHGGCVYSLADTIAGIAASTYGRYVTTVNSSINYLLPVIDTEYVFCESSVVRAGNRMSVFEVKLINDKQELLANASFTFFRMKQEI